jgi:hypothetical protein
MLAKPSGLEALLEEQIRSGVTAKPDYSDADAYEQNILKPQQGIAAQRQAALQERQARAGTLRDQALEAMKDSRPEWQQKLAAMAAAYDPKAGRLGGLKAIGQGASDFETQRKEQEAEKVKLEQLYYAQIEKYQDAGFSLQEAEILAQKDLMAERAKARAAAEAKRKDAVGELGEEVRSRRSSQTQRDVAGAYSASRASSGASGELSPKDIANLRDKARDNVAATMPAMEKIPYTRGDKAAVERFNTAVEQEFQRLLGEYGVPGTAARGGAGATTPTGATRPATIPTDFRKLADSYRPLIQPTR